MPARLCVSGRVALRRVVAAQRRAAFLAGAQVDPFLAYLHALFALLAFCVGDGGDRVKMRTGCVSFHVFLYLEAPYRRF